MSRRPVVDDRDRDAFHDEVRALADQYVESWDPSTDDNAAVLLRLFSQLGGDVIQRLNDVPLKHRRAFLDALGFDRRPPQAARLPLTFEVSTDLDRNVAIPGGTQAIAESCDGTTQRFELPQDGGFEATGASVTDVIAVDPSTDRIVDHSGVLTSDDPVELFTGDNLQEHVLYLAHDDLLTLEPGSPITITAETSSDSSVLETELAWEYYGEDDDGTVDWHPLAPWGRDTPDDESRLGALQQRLQSDALQSNDDRVELRFRLPGETVRHTVDGVESRWLRCRTTDDVSALEPFSLRLGSIAASVGRDTSEDGFALAPDVLLSNDVPLSTDEEEIQPLGRQPHPPATFYIACKEAFTKRDGIVEIRFDPPAEGDGTAGVTDTDASETTDAGTSAGGEDASPAQTADVLTGPPAISWEYWAGSGWSRLTVLEDETNDFRTAGRVRFSVPADIEPTAVSGHENVWIRARLVSGTYNYPSFGVTDAGTRRSPANSPAPPRFGGVSIRYDCGRQPFETVRTKNNASLSRVSQHRDEAILPFVELPDETQTLYLGFDDTLCNGPLTVFVAIADTTYPHAFDPGIRWEYCSDPAESTWERLPTQDRTGGLTERGIVEFTVPKPTTAFELFGRRRHWVRLRVTQDKFDRRVDSDTRTRSARSPLETERPRARPTPPPTLEGLYPNTQWASNTRTIEDEVLGSSDGSHDQSFACAHAPVIDIDVWVDEVETLSSSERRTLLEEQPEAVRRVTDASGDVTEWWVRWQQVPDRLESGPTDRHYVVDRIDGGVSFGDGNRGRIPPTGQGNITATYTTGGGRDGNVAADTITDLTSPIPLVEDVSNPQPATGGADTESSDALVSRTTARLKHRDRVVSPADYEQVATATFRELAKVVCNPSGATGGDDVVLVIVPRTRQEKPMPSTELEQRVRDAVRERAPASLVESDSSRIVVRGPRYAAVSVSVSLSTVDSTSVSHLKGAVERRLDEFLHPLDGNEGDGWEFGAVPSTDALTELVRETEHVAAVRELDATIDSGDDGESRVLGAALASLPPGTLVCSGAHEVTVSMAGEAYS